MGLMMSILVFTVGVLEAVSCLEHMRDGYLPLQYVGRKRRRMVMDVVTGSVKHVDIPCYDLAKRENVEQARSNYAPLQSNLQCNDGPEFLDGGGEMDGSTTEAPTVKINGVHVTPIHSSKMSNDNKTVAGDELILTDRLAADIQTHADSGLLPNDSKENYLTKPSENVENHCPTNEKMRNKVTFDLTGTVDMTNIPDEYGSEAGLIYDNKTTNFSVPVNPQHESQEESPSQTSIKEVSAFTTDVKLRENKSDNGNIPTLAHKHNDGKDAIFDYPDETLPSLEKCSQLGTYPIKTEPQDDNGYVSGTETKTHDESFQKTLGYSDGRVLVEKTDLITETTDSDSINTKVVSRATNETSEKQLDISNDSIQETKTVDVYKDENIQANGVKFTKTIKTAENEVRDAMPTSMLTEADTKAEHDKSRHCTTDHIAGMSKEVISSQSVPNCEVQISEKIDSSLTEQLGVRPETDQTATEESGTSQKPDFDKESAGSAESVLGPVEPEKHSFEHITTEDCNRTTATDLTCKGAERVERTDVPSKRNDFKNNGSDPNNGRSVRQQTTSVTPFKEDVVNVEAAEEQGQTLTPVEGFSSCSPEKAFWLIFSGEYTKAMSKDWHSGHFCCWQCDESLTGQRYVLRDDHPYCIKCYESVFANSCDECNKTIGIDSKDLSYKDKHWHEACFFCNKCRVSLVDKQFGSKADKIYCGNCYDAQFASRCDGCGQIFRAGTKKMEYKTRQWHEQCFCCCVCKTAIGTKSFIPREQEIYCATCYEEKFATRCVKCNKIITSGGVTYRKEPWHRECFTCTHCNTCLSGQRFTSRDEKPYCADCFGELFAKRCTSCCKPITGIGGTRFISFEDRHWHNDCFVCASCKSSLVGKGFITDADDIVCTECAKEKLM